MPGQTLILKLLLPCRNANIRKDFHAVQPERVQGELPGQLGREGGRVHKGGRIFGLLRGKSTLTQQLLRQLLQR